MQSVSGEAEATVLYAAAEMSSTDDEGELGTTSYIINLYSESQVPKGKAGNSCVYFKLGLDELLFLSQTFFAFLSSSVSGLVVEPQ